MHHSTKRQLFIAQGIVMQIKFMAALFAGLFAISNSVIAEECSSRSEDSVFIMDCLSARYKAADQELNTVYNEAMKSLSSDGKKKLEEAQKAWLKYRDASLAFITEVNRKTGSTGNFIIEDYRAALVEKRASELKYILSGPDAGPAEW
ncbi:MAG: DUF1311 domain-containing protein [Candidatus Competibacteraceae bacterium]|nr:MAG: DUF1311 domain-containing protein [Candidatus Competibacteraceae bacterium]